MRLPNLPHLQKILQPTPKIIPPTQCLRLLFFQNSQNFKIPNRFSQVVGLQSRLGRPVQKL